MFPIRRRVLRAGRRGWGLTAKAEQHSVNRGHLPAGLRGIVGIIIAPPIPAAIRIAQGPMRFGVEDDQAIAIGPAMIAGQRTILVTDQLGGLLAAMKGDVYAAKSAVGTRSWNIDKTGLAQTVAGRIVDKVALIELDQLTAWFIGRLIEWPINLGQ